ncbi:MAG: FAD-dependent oxidoreductase [Trueperaceae bacterium]
MTVTDSATTPPHEGGTGEGAAPLRTDDRARRFARLGASTFDVLVIGGGATGTGVALDAASRGLSVALVERFDLSQGTSSRSTKLVHGGVRYLEQAVRHADRSQFHLVREALRERAVLLRNAPHIARPLPLLTPIYGALELPYYFTGLKLYDMLAGRANLRPSRLLTRAEALERFPMLKADGLRGAVEYHDGQFDDARMNVTLAVTAAEAGALILNHVAVHALVKEGGRVRGVLVRDRLGADGAATELEVRARVVVNATGPFADAVRRLDDPNAAPMLKASSGAHVVLPARFSPPGTGLLIPKTEDGRVLFLLPWQGHTLVGTTDNEVEVHDDPQATEDDVAYILRHVRVYFDLDIHRSDVLAAWSGLRPLVEAQSTGHGTARLSRDHVVEVSEGGLVTIAGGKWTTYRHMAEETVDVAVEQGGLAPAQGSVTADLPLAGAENFDSDGHHVLEREFGLPPDVARHLNTAYGSRAHRVARLAAAGYGERLAPGHPYLEAEVLYARDHEFACNADDVLHRRTRLAFVDAAAAEASRARVEALLREGTGG